MKFSPIYLTKSEDLSDENQNTMNNSNPPSEKSQLAVYRDVKVEIKQEPDILQQKQRSPNLKNVSGPHGGEIMPFCKNETDSNILIQEKKAVEKLQPRRNPETGGAKNYENLVNVSISSIAVPVAESDQEMISYSVNVEKVEKLQPRRNLEPAVQNSLGKGSDDGYNWRKYGQKLVKGNKFIRSYYKCTSLNCQAKRQVEISHDGSKTNINYLGTHYHPKPQNSPLVSSTSQVRILDTQILPTSKSDAEPIVDHGGASQLKSDVACSGDGLTAAVSCLNDNDSKRQKREITCADDNVISKSYNDFRHVVQTLSEVDLVNDGYRWRKYGQKLVKGNPNPRSYYRCSAAGCQVKKHVERASYDPKLVITTYEGQHDHHMPPSRAVSQSPTTTTSNANNIMTTIGEPRPKPEENNNPAVGLDMVVHVSSG
ncbi:hypothetical protein CASFOL_011251 [Castilleja foliolosa]|uniref:WRKY domain-containing protein n=1 Tax=Castilleja foliolosa TaxID=1961234 RepID=A0ABD3DUY2_9LAMI